MAGVYRLEVPLQGAIATRMPGVAGFWAGLDRQSRVLTAAVAASLLLHAILLSVHFRFPNELRWKGADQRLDVILVNAKSRQRPAKVDALAQNDLDGGGETEQNRRAKYYELTAAGRRALGAEAKQWKEYVAMVDMVLRTT